MSPEVEAVVIGVIGAVAGVLLVAASILGAKWLGAHRELRARQAEEEAAEKCREGFGISYGIDMKSPQQELQNMLDAYRRYARGARRSPFRGLPCAGWCFGADLQTLPSEERAARMRKLLATGADLRMPDLEAQLESARNSPHLSTVYDMLNHYGPRRKNSPPTPADTPAGSSAAVSRRFASSAVWAWADRWRQDRTEMGQGAAGGAGARGGSPPAAGGAGEAPRGSPPRGKPPGGRGRGSGNKRAALSVLRAVGAAGWWRRSRNLGGAHQGGETRGFSRPVPRALSRSHSGGSEGPAAFDPGASSEVSSHFSDSSASPTSGFAKKASVSLVGLARTRSRKFSLKTAGAQDRWLLLTANPSFKSLQMVDSWFFDADHWAEFGPTEEVVPSAGDGSGGEPRELGPLGALAMYLLERTGLVRHFKLDREKLGLYLERVESKYRDNPYHNRLHAADVLQTLHVIIHEGGLIRQMDEVGLLAAYLAAVVHDVGHLGVNNPFLVETGHRLALTYNDQSVQENMHAAEAFLLLEEPELDFLGHLPQRIRSEIRQLVIALVLATDMSRHFALLGAFQAAENITQGSIAPQMSKPILDFVGMRVGSATAGLKKNSPSSRKFSPARKHVRNDTLSLQIAIKCADLGHNCEKRSVHKQWVARVQEEFWQQGDLERAKGLQVPQMNDRSLHSPATEANSQVAFQELFCTPLFNSLGCAFPGTLPMAQQSWVNLQYWRERGKEHPSMSASARLRGGGRRRAAPKPGGQRIRDS